MTAMHWPGSIFHRRVQRLVWVVFALIGLLPLLALARITLVLLAGRPDVWLLVQAAALVLFSGACLVCGLTLLLRLTRGLQEAAAQTALLGRASGAPAAEPFDGSASELLSMTASLGHLHEQFSRTLERLQAQAAFLENLEHVLAHTSDMVIILDGRNQITFTNQTARQKLGLLPGSPLARAIAESGLTPAAAARLTAVLESWADRDEEFTLDAQSIGDVCIHLIQTVVRRAGAGDSKIVILRDLSERKRLDRQLFRSEQLAALGQLVSGVAHELNNPLTAVLGFAEICRTPGLSREELYGNLEVIEREASRTAHIVENLLNFSRQRHTRRSATDVHKLLERCFTLLAYTFRSYHITVKRAYSSLMPCLVIDEFQIQQVFVNLIINAVHAMRDAGTRQPTITVRTRVLPERRQVSVEIEDNGPGIPADLQTRVFEPFFTTKREEQGTGLGLTVSRGIMREHGGDLGVATRLPGTGALLVMTLPLPDQPMAQPGGAVVDVQTHRPSQGHVLVVDDEPSIVSMACQALRAQGLEVSTANGVAAAVTLMSSYAFDAVVSDICMPDGDVAELWNLARRPPRGRPCPILFITGAPSMAAMLRERVSEPLVTLQKPFHLHDLSVAVIALLKSAEATAGSDPGH